MDTSAYLLGEMACNTDATTPVAWTNKLSPLLRYLSGLAARWELCFSSVVRQRMLHVFHLTTSFKGFPQCPRDSPPSTGAQTF